MSMKLDFQKEYVDLIIGGYATAMKEPSEQYKK